MSNQAKLAIAVGAISLIFVAAATIPNNNQTEQTSNQGQQTTVSAPEPKAPVEHVTEEKRIENVAYGIQYIDDYDLEYDKTAVHTYGQYGTKTYTYRVVYLDGEEQSRELISEEITKQPVDQVIANGKKIVWDCVDVTSYDRNAYNDNLCTSSTGEQRYTSDSQAVALDPDYVPGKRGAYYYNNK